MSAPASFRGRYLLLSLPLLLFAILRATTLSHVAPSGDGASAWGSRYPTRTVLCVEPGRDRPRLTLAAADRYDEGALRADVVSSEVVWGSERWGVAFRDHVYRAAFRLGGGEWPFMINDYTGGITDWPEHGGFLAAGMAGAAVAAGALGGLAILLTMVAASRFAGRAGAGPAAFVAGAFLATEPWFHAWKRINTGRETAGQIAAAALLLACFRLRERATGRDAVVAGVVAGFGLHCKLSFLGPAAGLAACAAASLVLDRRRRRAAPRVAVLGVVAALLASSPTWGYWLARPDVVSVSAQGGLAENLRSLRARLGAGPDATEDLPMDDPKGSAGRDLKQTTSILSALLAPSSFFDRYWATDGAAEPSQPPRFRVVLAGAAFLVALGMFGPGAADRRWLLAAVAAQYAAVRALNGDPHHLPMVLPTVAVLLGVSAAAFGERVARWRGRPGVGLVAACAIGVALAVEGTAALAGLERELVAHGGRLRDRHALTALGDALVQAGAREPAVLEYEAMSLLEAWSGDRVRPYFYGVAGEIASGRCLDRRGDDWLLAVISAHRGRSLLLFAQRGLPDDASRAQLEGEVQRVERLGARMGIAARAVLRQPDEQGRAFAVLLALGP